MHQQPSLSFACFFPTLCPDTSHQDSPASVRLDFSLLLWCLWSPVPWEAASASGRLLVFPKWREGAQPPAAAPALSPVKPPFPPHHSQVHPSLHLPSTLTRPLWSTLPGFTTSHLIKLRDLQAECFTTGERFPIKDHRAYHPVKELLFLRSIQGNRDGHI